PPPGYGSPSTPPPSPGYGSPAAPAPSPGYGSPSTPPPSPGYGSPGAPPPGYGSPGAPPPGSGGGWGPAPGYGGPGAAPGYGAPTGAGPAPGQRWPPGYGGASAPFVVRHRPGIGLIVGLLGLLGIVLAHTSLPWISEDGVEVTFSDIRDAFAGDGGGAPSGATPTVTVPEVSLPPGVTLPPGAPPAGQVVTPPAAPAGSAGDELEYLERYAGWVWYVVLGLGLTAVLSGTLLVPRDRAARVATGFLAGGLLGAVASLADRDGEVAHRVAGAFGAIGAGTLCGFAVADVFPDKGGPSPAAGVWAGIGGLLLVLLGCVLGTRTERVPAGR
ncbi:MAG TPA: hypothetical protein VFI47_29510, partial [Acidimicrobiales bacterium]|nr:hypothetical protein [Acidimicrobiales bacterium]